jgi:hypothetical protein
MESEFRSASLSDAALHARQLASRRVTVMPDDRCMVDAAGCTMDAREKCDWCRTRPRVTDGRMIVNPLPIIGRARGRVTLGG